MSATTSQESQPEVNQLERIIARIRRKLSHSGYEPDVYFEVLGGGVSTFRRGLENIIVYIPQDENTFREQTLKILDTIVHVIGFHDVFYAHISPVGDVTLRKHEPKPETNLISRCKMFIRLLSSITEGQWFDHIRHRAKLRARASVELIRTIRVLEEMNVLGVTWRKFGAGAQHTLIVNKKLSKGELVYFLARLLNIAAEKSLRRVEE